MSLEVSLKQEQIDAACRLHEKLIQWQLSEAALIHLHDALPGFTKEDCLLKCIAINSLYGTQVLAIVRMSQHIHNVIRSFDSPQQLIAAGHQLVEKIALMPPKKAEKQKRRLSFAAKFCHFFIDQERYPIYDDAARQAIRLHLGNNYLPGDKTPPYADFCDAIQLLRAEAGLVGPGRSLDRYLWISGMYSKWKKGRHKSEKDQQMNVELRELFSNPTSDLKRELEQILPCPFDRKA